MFIWQIILCLLALTGPILCIIVFDRSVILPFEIITEGLNAFRIVCAYGFLIYYMRKPHLINLLSVAYHHEPKRIRRLGNFIFFSNCSAILYSCLFLAMVLVSSGGFMPSYYTFALTSTDYWKHYLSLFVVSSLVYQTLWGATMVVFWLTLHLVADNWRKFIGKLRKGNLSSISMFLAKLVTIFR
jgi:hypothetical protein